jgi:hypothetical protein
MYFAQGVLFFPWIISASSLMYPCRAADASSKSQQTRKNIVLHTDMQERVLNIKGHYR